MHNEKVIRITYNIEGIVQGVGFRPALYNLAVRSRLGGWVKNRSGNVELALEGDEKDIHRFISSLKENLPPQSRIDRIVQTGATSIPGAGNFRILESSGGGSAKVLIPADLAICKDCAEEISDRNNRRYRYPFTTCVNCGPRYTVINSMPYDRCRTTLSEFPLCGDCSKEYSDTADRRFHAESMACPACGPGLSWHDRSGKITDHVDPLGKFQETIRDGRIIALRGIGGYLLACDAFNRQAITDLRKRKCRPHKPFAVMARDIDIAGKYCKISIEEEQLLKSPAAPIVILDIKPDMTAELPFEMLSPDTLTLGVMLPYSPLHLLLFGENIELMVMTSGNRRGEPVCIKNAEAFERLGGIADAFLVHNREINLRNDDSVCVVLNGKSQVWRRARGFAPGAVKLRKPLKSTVLSLGAELKNTIAVGYEDEVVLSPHIGDLETPEAVDGLETSVRYLPEFLEKNPDLIAVDLHPDMHSTRTGLRLSREKNIPAVKVQHHFAHAASCMAEHGLEDSLALVFDGTGLGYDGTIWGAELLYISQEKKERLASFAPAILLGGDKAVTHPGRQLLARWMASGFSRFDEIREMIGLSLQDMPLLKKMHEQNLNSIASHSAGRLFDAFSMALGISPSTTTYEGQAAIRLETEAAKASGSISPIRKERVFSIYEKNGLLLIDWSELFRLFSPEFCLELQSSDDYLAKRSAYAFMFHRAIAEAALEMVKYGAEKFPTGNIVLSGGVFMNRILTGLVSGMIRSETMLRTYIHHKIPPNDGGISLGQVMLAELVASRQECADAQEGGCAAGMC